MFEKLFEFLISQNLFSKTGKKFNFFLVALVGIPTVLGVAIVNADKFSGIIKSASIATTIMPTGNSGVDKNVKDAVSDFFDSTDQVLLLVTDTNTAIAATSKLKQSNRFVIEITRLFDTSDRSAKAEISKSISNGMRSLAPQLYKLQSDSRIWEILYP